MPLVNILYQVDVKAEGDGPVSKEALETVGMVGRNVGSVIDVALRQQLRDEPVVATVSEAEVTVAGTPPEGTPGAGPGACNAGLELVREEEGPES